MAIRKLNPYLNFNGTAAKAIQLYESALGARTENRMTFGDMPDAKVAPGDKDRVMHALLRIGEGVVMISDTMPNTPTKTEGNIHVTLDFDDAAEMARRFDALAVGGTVTMPLTDTFWGARFGMLRDAFGIQWMFNCEIRKT
jgi:PhnB protein